MGGFGTCAGPSGDPTSSPAQAAAADCVLRAQGACQLAQLCGALVAASGIGLVRVGVDAPRQDDEIGRSIHRSLRVTGEGGSRRPPCGTSPRARPLSGPGSAGPATAPCYRSGPDICTRTGRSLAIRRSVPIREPHEGPRSPNGGCQRRDPRIRFMSLMASEPCAHGRSLFRSRRPLRWATWCRRDSVLAPREPLG